QLQKAVDQQVGAGTLQIPSFDLGTTATVAYAYDLPPVFYQGVCAAISMQNVPKFIELPKCQVDFPISIRLEAKNGDKTIIAVKDIHLAYSADAPLNQNPQIDDAGFA